jgi:hypothetical protein
MGRILQSRTPAQLLWIVAVANVLMISSFAIPLIQSWRLPEEHSLSLAAKLTFLTIYGTWLIGGLLAGSVLRKGITRNQWPEALLATPRKLLEHPAISALCWALIVAAFAAMVFSRGSHLSGFWPVLIVQTSITNTRLALRKQAKADESGGLLHPARPLQSENWGTPPRPFST